MSTRDEPTVGSARTASDRSDARIPETDHRNAAEKVAAPVGGAAGALTGATAGTLVAGPVGGAIGAIAGAVGGWWAGAGVEREAELAPEDEQYYRTHYEASAPPGGEWSHVRPVYQLGHLAARNPEYRGRSFADIETDLRHGWRADTSRLGEWDAVRDLARAAYERSTGTVRLDGGADVDRDLTNRADMRAEGQR